MIKIPLTILLSLAVFVIFAGVLLVIFGSPKCDSLANSTAYYLKSSIDEVSASSFYSWDEGGVPPDDQVSYYRTAPIMLCQDKGISYLETILGTTLEPQYKIYYERFPEGGGGMWTEAYPWSGGAAATLRIWAFLRIGTGALTFAAKYLTKAGEFTAFMNGMKGVASKIKESLAETEIDDIARLAEESGEVGVKPLTNPASWYLDGAKAGEASINIKEGVNAGIFVKLDENGNAAVSNGRLIISETPVPVSVEDVSTGNLIPVYVQRDSSGNIIDLTTDASKGWPQLEVSPADVYNEWLDTMPDSLKGEYNDIYVTESDAGSRLSWTNIKGNVKNSGFYQAFFAGPQEKLDEFLTKIDTLGYRVDYIDEMLPEEINGMKLGTIEALDNPDVYNMLANQPNFKNMVAKAVGKSADSIKASDIANFLNGFNLNGILFQVKGQDLEVVTFAIKKIAEASNEGTVLYSSGLKNIIFNDPEGEQIIADMSNLLGISEGDATNRVGSIIDSMYESGFYNPSGPINQVVAIGKNKPGLYSAFTDTYLNNLAQSYKAGDEKAAIQLASFLGFVEQNKGELPTQISKTGKAIASDYFKSQGKKMIYLDGPQNIVNPDSFYARALFPYLSTAGCEGNSICVYSSSAMMENPLYLSSDAENFEGNVRLWRPVSWTEQWLGFQAALQHVPENPRFYVVSPCMATAKIWKTTYNGQPTIFIYPQKVDLGDDASNYCYADSNLINEYFAVWSGSDAATIITTITGIGAAEGAMKIVNKVINTADPVTLAQGLIEGAISWPGWPFKTLTWEQISANAGKIGIKQIEIGSQSS